MAVFRALRRRMILARMVTLAAVAALAGCGQPPGQPRAGEPEALTLTGVSRLPAGADAPVDAAVAGLDRFADQFRAAAFQRGENAVFSPLSIGYAFAMLRAAAAGPTAAQLDRLFGFPTTGVHQAYNALTGRIVTAGGPPPRATPGATRDPDRPPAPPVVAIANGLFVRSGLRPAEAFLRTLAEQYGAPAQAVDFSSQQAARIINGWVQRQTAGRIERLFDSLDPATAAVIANAVYLKADWREPFDERATRQQPFRRADGSTVQVPMMHPLASGLQYAAGTGWQAVELPYAGNELAMWVLVPDRDQPPDRLLRPEVLAAARAGARPAAVDFAMPRWDFATSVDLLDVVHRLGLGNLTDLPGIAPDASVGAAVHRANISVDEWGTEAAAVTGLAVVLSAGPAPEVVVHADHPFAFAIVHRATGAPLFLGQLADPRQQ
jgi:serpin B